jgi:hypothetical protein
MNKNVKSGYLLKIITWENDADNYNTKEIEGLSEHEVRFYTKIAQLFNSCHDTADSDTRFGNADKYRYNAPKFPINGPYPDRSAEKYRREDDMMLPVRIKEIVDAHKKEFGSVPDFFDYEGYSAKYDNVKFETDADFRELFNDALYDIIGSWADGEYWRVFESFEVFWIPEQIKNVTSEFK